LVPLRRLCAACAFAGRRGRRAQRTPGDPGVRRGGLALPLPALADRRPEGRGSLPDRPRARPAIARSLKQGSGLELMHRDAPIQDLTPAITSSLLEALCLA